MVERFKKWNCFLCGDIVVEGQRFGYIPDKGFMHIECLREKITKLFNGNIPAEIGALLDLEEISAYGIVRVKEIESLLDNELRKMIEGSRHKLEGISALAGKLLKDTLKKYDLDL